MTDWQPIETAPRDGKPVLVWNSGCSYWIASFRLPLRGERYYQDAHAVREWRDDYGRFATPTHWMPLPPPPVGAEKRDWR